MAQVHLTMEDEILKDLMLGKSGERHKITGKQSIYGTGKGTVNNRMEPYE